MTFNVARLSHDVARRPQVMGKTCDALKPIIVDADFEFGRDRGDLPRGCDGSIGGNSLVQLAVCGVIETLTENVQVLRHLFAVRRPVPEHLVQCVREFSRRLLELRRGDDRETVVVQPQEMDGGGVTIGNVVGNLVDLLRGDQQRIDCLPKDFPAAIGAFASLAPFGVETSRPLAPEPEHSAQQGAGNGADKGNPSTHPGRVASPPASVTECGPRLSRRSAKF
ncbi:hypothetical protein ACFVYA_06125 [Amycolatopsis sp. NPDC058278]|uniref:hypothetical protein n=1 Tax=Amycolatopsis sp. NPDC058278 TaxID=3346417 RepID=UPI0036DDFFB8